jgi:outer membrane protein TolC
VQLDEAKTAYFPTIKMDGLYRKKDKVTAFEPKIVQGVELGGTLTLFDGFRREAALKGLHASLDAASHTVEQEEQTVFMETILAYYDYFDATARFEALEAKKTELLEQLKRVSVMVENDLSTHDVLQSLIASKLEVEYNQQQERIIQQKSKKNLELLSGLPLDTLEYRDLVFKLPDHKERHDLQADQAMVETLHQSEQNYTYLPTLILQGKHKTMNYRDYDTMGGINLQPVNQNEVTASLSLTLFDGGRIAKEREQAHLMTLKAQKMVEYKRKSLQNEEEISQLTLQATQSALRAAQAEASARREAFEIIKKRFEVGLIPTTTYLSELSALSLAVAKVQTTHHALQVAYAQCAYASGMDLQNLLEKQP